MHTNGKPVDDFKPRTGQGLSAGSRKTQFQKRHGGVRKGRQPGSVNRVNAILKDAILEAAAQVGDLTGLEVSEKAKTGIGGLTGYLKWIAVHHPKPFVSLLGRLLPLQQIQTVDHYSATIYKSYREVAIEFDGFGLSIDAIQKLKSMDLRPDDVETDAPSCFSLAEPTCRSCSTRGWTSARRNRSTCSKATHSSGPKAK
jgi:hypothetical protein